MYEVLIERRAERDMQRLETAVFKRIVEAVRLLSSNPRHAGCRKISGSASDWRVRVGDYRIVYEINEKEKAVKIMRVKHRKDAYR